MEFKAYIHQCGEGCDYTIGCAQTVIDLPNATNMTEAIEELKQKIEGDEEEEDGYTEERTLEKAVIFGIAEEHEMDLDSVYQEISDKEIRLLREYEEEEERREYERLRKKFAQ